MGVEGGGGAVVSSRDVEGAQTQYRTVKSELYQFRRYKNVSDQSGGNMAVLFSENRDTGRVAPRTECGKFEISASVHALRSLG